VPDDDARLGLLHTVPALAVTFADRAAAIATAPGAAGVVAVLATLEATLGPTGRLVARALTVAGGAGARMTSEVVPGAAAARAAGDVATHDRPVAGAVRRVAASADVVVLTQASMATAASGPGVRVPVLTSPADGADALVEAARGA
jgi:hypothetical protein